MLLIILGERDILSFQVKCTHSDHGCEWVGELRQLEEHVKKMFKRHCFMPLLCRRLYRKNFEEESGSTQEYIHRGALSAGHGTNNAT